MQGRLPLARLLTGTHRSVAASRECSTKQSRKAKRECFASPPFKGRVADDVLGARLDSKRERPSNLILLRPTPVPATAEALLTTAKPGEVGPGLQEQRRTSGHLSAGRRRCIQSDGVGPRDAEIHGPRRGWFHMFLMQQGSWTAALLQAICTEFS